MLDFDWLFLGHRGRANGKGILGLNWLVADILGVFLIGCAACQLQALERCGLRALNKGAIWLVNWMDVGVAVSS